MRGFVHHLHISWLGFVRNDIQTYDFQINSFVGVTSESQQNTEDLLRIVELLTKGSPNTSKPISLEK